MSKFPRFKRGLMLLAWLTSLAVAAADSRSTMTIHPGEFRFARMMYVDDGGGRRNFGGRGWWAQDWPEAETHFNFNLQRLTRLSVGEPVTVQLTDDDLFKYPWLYATQTGYWYLDDEEVARLREYLLRGGFLMCDDFFGEDEFAVFADTMARVFPDRQMEQLHGDDAVLHVVFSIDEATQIPGWRHIQSGQAGYLPPPVWLGIYDDAGRLMVGINYNQDVGDSWEESNTPGYPEPMTAQGYRFGINYITYAMTH